MVDARRRNPGPFYRQPHLVHQAKPDFAVPLVLDHAADAVQEEPNRRLNDLDFHSYALGLREVGACFFRFVAASQVASVFRPSPVSAFTNGSMPHTSMTKDMSIASRAATTMPPPTPISPPRTAPIQPKDCQP